MKPSTSTLLNSRLPRSFREIHLELAREKDHPEGDRAIGYTLIAPLDDDGRIDAEIWRSHRDACRVVRRRPLAEHTTGKLVHRPGGSWAFRYGSDKPKTGKPGTKAANDDVGYHFADECFIPGEYVTVKEGEREHTYIVSSVRPLA